MIKLDKLKEILINLNNTKPTLESFFEYIEKNTQGKATFTKFRKALDECYPQVNKSK